MSAAIPLSQPRPAEPHAAGGYRADIDGMRGVAVALVCLFHAGCWPFSGGYIGVDVFFVISGFVITRVLLAEKDARRLSLSRFFMRRIRRLAPALLVMLFACIVVFSVVYPPAYLRGFGQSLWAQSLFGANFYFWRTADYFGAPYEAEPLLHTWSLAVEEQFYLFFAAGLLLLARVGRTPLLLTMGGCLLASLCLSAVATVPQPNASFYLLPTRAWELLSGAVLALYLSTESSKEPGPVTANLLATAGLVAVAVAAVCYDNSTPFPSFYAALPVAGTAAMIWADAHVATFVSRLLSLRPMIFLGKISYSLYLWHWVALVFVRWTSFGSPTAAARTGALVVAGIIATLSWRWIETPVRERTVMASNRRLLWAAGLATLATGLYGFFAAESGGFPWRPGARLAAIQTPSLSPRQHECFDNESPSSVSFCAIGAQSAARVSFLAIGDSHGLAMLPALENAAAAQGLKGWFAGTSGCLPFIGAIPVREASSKARCEHINNEALRVAQERGIHHVILVARWDYYTRLSHDGTFQPVVSRTHRATTVAASQAVFAEQYRATIAAYEAIGASVAIILQVPHQWMDPQSFVYRQTLPGFLGGIRGPEAGTVTLADHREALRFADEVLESASQVLIVDPAPLLCPRGDVCMLFSAGRTLYYDNNHLSVVGAQLVAPTLAPLFAQIGAG